MSARATGGTASTATGAAPDKGRVDSPEQVLLLPAGTTSTSNVTRGGGEHAGEEEEEGNTRTRPRRRQAIAGLGDPDPNLNWSPSPSAVGHKQNIK